MALRRCGRRVLLLHLRMLLLRVLLLRHLRLRLRLLSFVQGVVLRLQLETDLPAHLLEGALRRRGPGYRSCRLRRQLRDSVCSALGMLSRRRCGRQCLRCRQRAASKWQTSGKDRR